MNIIYIIIEFLYQSKILPYCQFCGSKLYVLLLIITYNDRNERERFKIKKAKLSEENKQTT